MRPHIPEHALAWCIGASLALVTLLLYLPTASHAFIDYDDNLYVFENPHVVSGLSLANLSWAFTTGYAANWHPLTWISHMLDCQVFGVVPGPQHVVNALLHTANSVILFLALWRMTRRLWRGAFVSALFAFHPAHVESVAWIAERKDLLSAFFFLLAILAYQSYAARTREVVHFPEDFSAIPRRRRKFPSRDPRSAIRIWLRRSLPRYLPVALLFSFGLMSKPMAVTLPVILLLLDYWPLGRLQSMRQLWPLLLEKVPLAALSAASCVITFLDQRAAGAMATLQGRPLLQRLANALDSIYFYFGKLLWPRDLILPYVDGPSHGPAILALACAGLLALSLAAFAFGRRAPYLPVGWLWFLATLLPVLGFVQVGVQSAADRFTYIPSIGFFIILVWAAGDLALRFRAPRAALFALGAAILFACIFLAQRQIGYWKNSETLFLHSVEVDPDNLEADNCLAVTYATDPDAALRNPARAVRIAAICVDATSRKNVYFLDTLSTAYAAAHQFQLAIATDAEALRAPENVDAEIATIQSHLRLYQQGRAIHEP